MRFSVLKFKSSALALGLVFCLTSMTGARAADSGGTTNSSLDFLKNDSPAQVQTGSVTQDKPRESKVKFPDLPEHFGGFQETPNFLPPPPLPRASMPSRSRGSGNGQDDWAFITPQDVINDYMVRESLKAPGYEPDGRSSDSLSPVERYYQRLARGHTATNSESAFDPFENGALQFGGQTMPGVGANLGQPGVYNPGGYAPGNYSRMDSNPAWNAGGSSRPNDLADLLGLQNRVQTPEDILRDRDDQNRQMEAFKRILNYQQPSAALPGFGQAGGYSLPGQTGNGYPSGYAHTSWGGGLGNPFETPRGYPNPAASSAPSAPTGPLAPAAPIAPGSPLASGLYGTTTEPAPAASARVVPPKLDFSIPQRSF